MTSPNDSAAETLSVIIVSWNAREYLQACLQSLRDTRPACVKEIIVADNASVDGSPEMVAERFPEAILIRTGANLGFARANNLAMLRASGSAVALVNSDALVHPGCLETLAGHLEAHPEVGLAGPRVIGGDGNLQRTCRHLPGLWNTFCRAVALDRLFGEYSLFSGYEVPASHHERLHEAEVLSGCFCVARRSAVSQVGGFDERFFFYAEDIDWSKRFRDAGWKLAFVPEATATHFGGGSSSKASLRFSIEMLRATLIYWGKHHGAFGERACRQLLILHHGLRFAIRSVQRAVNLGQSERGRHKWVEDFASLRWLVFGTEPEAHRLSGGGDIKLEGEER